MSLLIKAKDFLGHAEKDTILMITLTSKSAGRKEDGKDTHRDSQ